MHYIINTLSVLVALSLEQAISQSVVTQKCREYKRQVYEDVTLIGFFLHDAPTDIFSEDTCENYGRYSDDISPFIVGGGPAKPQEFPHMARLGRYSERKYNWFCGGTLISELYVLTAGHCFYASVGEVNRVRLGQVAVNSNFIDYEVRRNIPHPQYNESGVGLVENDIGLIELDRPVQFSKSIHPACLPQSVTDESNKVIAIGWGSTKFGGKNSDKLLKVNLDLFPSERCDDLISSAMGRPTGIDIRTQTCAGSSSAKDTCKGDSGGSLLSPHREFPCMYYVTGITSAGIGGCGTPNLPGIYTRVNGFIPWIIRTVWHIIEN